MLIKRPSAARGHADHGWLRAALGRLINIMNLLDACTLVLPVGMWL